MKRYYFIATFSGFYDCALPLIEENGGDITIIVATEELYKFLTEFTDYKVKKLKVDSTLITKKTWHKLILNFIRYRYEYKELFDEIKGCEVYFFNTSCHILMFSYIKKLAKYNKVYLYVAEMNYNGLHIVKRPLSKMMNLFTYVFLGLDTVVIYEVGRTAFRLKKSFYDKNNIEVVNYNKEDVEIFKKYLSKTKLNDIVKDKQILFAISDLGKFGRLKSDVFYAKLEEILNIFKECNLKYLVKTHPSYPVHFEEENSVPSYIPAELMMSFDWDFVVSIESELLMFASKLSKGKVISLIYLIPYESKREQNILKDWLAKDSDGVLFPETMNELKVMLGDKHV